MTKSVDIIGAGISGLYAASYLAKNGYKVTVHEKNETIGGRSRVFQSDGFTFDMGPSWYWMPELIDQMFDDLGENRSDYFSLKRIKPSYKVFWKNERPSEVPENFEELKKLFDSFEQYGGEKLEKFIQDAKTKYEIAVDEFLFKPGLKISELLTTKVLLKAIKLDVLKSVEKDVSNRFLSSKAQAILNFPILFLGEMPNRIPSLYTLMNYADLKLGTWYPEGGMGVLPKTLYKIALQNGVEFNLNSALEKVSCVGNRIDKITVGGELIETQNVLVSADYHHIEQEIIPAKYRNYSKKYWNSRKLAPSCLIFYVGLDKEVPGLRHHNLFFDEDLIEHGKTIYNDHSWPENPLFYVCAPSKTDKTVAPLAHENLFFLIPISPDLEDNEEIREDYFAMLVDRIKKHLSIDITSHIKYKRSYCVNDFKEDYNAFKGNAYGLANTLMQTANLKPKITSKLDNLNYCGQLTVPGPGVPPALISGQITAKQIILQNE